MKKIVLTLAVLIACIGLRAQETYLYAQKDTCSLYFDIYRPSAGSKTEHKGVRKPTIIHVFGGGFKMGARNEAYQTRRFRTLTDNGYTVVAIDYRLGMKGYKLGKGLPALIESVEHFYKSQQMGVEDVFSAIAYLKEHPELGIDVNNIVVSGSSAGAIISLASAYAIANGKAAGVPDGFRLKGVVSYAGGIISLSGAPRFAELPCPILFMHGIKDKVVAYKHLSAFGKGVWGSNFLVKKLKKMDANYSIYRVKDRAHDVASYMNELWLEEQLFLERNVMQGERCIIDATIDNPELPVWNEWGRMTPQDLYDGN